LFRYQIFNLGGRVNVSWKPDLSTLKSLFQTVTYLVLHKCSLLGKNLNEHLSHVLGGLVEADIGCWAEAVGGELELQVTHSL
jgi:hypothetical protein